MERILPLIAILLTSLYFEGVINRVRSISGGRRGPGFLQIPRDIWRLLRKGSVFSTTTSSVFQFAPVVYFASVLTAVLIVPFDHTPGLISFHGDFIFFAYVMALGRFFLILSAMDTGSPFEGMGANREALYGMLAEPAFFVLIGSFSLITDTNSFAEIYFAMHFGNNPILIFLGIISGYVLIQLMMIEASRMPVDDPATHLELTMKHEVMVLDNSGFDMGLILLARSLKFALYGALIVNFLIPPGVNIIWKLIAYLGLQTLVASLVGVMESFRARNRMNYNPQFVFTLVIFSLMIFFAVLIITNRFIG